MDSIVPVEVVERKIYLIRGQKVMLDKDLAVLYSVKPIRLREQVKRNIRRFPDDFMFQLNEKEIDSMVSQNAIPSRKYLGGYQPYVFTEQGVAMLSGILNSDVAINVNIAIMRTFVMIRRYALEHKEFNAKLLEIETKYDKKFSDVYEALNYLIKKDEKETVQKERKQIGYKK